MMRTRIAEVNMKEWGMQQKPLLFFALPGMEFLCYTVGRNYPISNN